MASAPCGAATWRPFILDACRHAPHATYPDGGPETALRVAPLAVPIRSCSRWGLPCRPCCQVARWALTPPFHPCRALARRPRRAVCFLWHFPWGRPRRTLSGTVFPWSPDFPHPQPFGFRGCGRPAGWQGDKGVCCEKRNQNPRQPRLRRRPDAASPSSSRQPKPGSCARRMAGIVAQDRAAGRAARRAGAPCPDISCRT